MGESKEMINKSKNTEAIQSAVNKRRKCRSFPTKKKIFFPHLKRENKNVEPILPVSLSQHLIWPDLLAVLEIKRPGHLNKSLEVQPDLFFYFLFCIKREKLNPNFLYQTSSRSIGFTDTHQRSREWRIMIHVCSRVTWEEERANVKVPPCSSSLTSEWDRWTSSHLSARWITCIVNRLGSNFQVIHEATGLQLGYAIKEDAMGIFHSVH